MKTLAAHMIISPTGYISQDNLSLPGYFLEKPACQNHEKR